MKNKSQSVVEFIENLHKFIVENPQFRKNTKNKNEAQVQTELRSILLHYLEKYYEKCGYKKAANKATKSFYWEGQEGQYKKKKEIVFGSKNYPDFIITEPYLVAIEYKQSASGSLVKTGFGQSIMHTLGSEFHYVYLLFHDEGKDKKIEKSIHNERETFIINKMWDDFNVYVKFI